MFVLKSPRLRFPLPARLLSRTTVGFPFFPSVLYQNSNMVTGWWFNTTSQVTGSARCGVGSPQINLSFRTGKYVVPVVGNVSELSSISSFDESRRRRGRLIQYVTSRLQGVSLENGFIPREWAFVPRTVLARGAKACFLSSVRSNHVAKSSTFDFVHVFSRRVELASSMVNDQMKLQMSTPSVPPVLS